MKQAMKVLTILVLTLFSTVLTWAASDAAAREVSYVDENGVTQTVSALPLDTSTTALVANQWYVAESSLTFAKGLTSLSTVRSGYMCIIVADGATLTVGTESSPVEGDAISNIGGLYLYGQGSATGKLSVHSTGNGIAVGNVYAIANLDVDVTCSNDAICSDYNATDGGSVIAGHPAKGNTVTTHAGGRGIFAGGHSLTIKYCDVEVTGAVRNEAGEYAYCGLNGIAESGGSLLSVIGSAGGNTVKVCSNANGIDGGGCPVNIRNCTVDVIAKGNYGITSAGSRYGVIIDGLATGSNAVTVRCANSGIHGVGSSVVINNCDVTVTGLYDESTGGYGFCSTGGISENGIGANGVGISIAGCANGNRVTIRSDGKGGIYGDNSPVDIKNCAVDIISKAGSYGIYANGGKGLTIEGLAGAGSDVTLRCAKNGLYGWGYPINITDCNVTVTGPYNEETDEYDFCAASGIYVSALSAELNITGCAGGNNVTVRCNGSGGIYGKGCSVTIKNCSVDVDSHAADYGIYATSGSGLTIEGLEDGSSDVTVRCANNGIWVEACPVTIRNCDVEVTGLYDRETASAGTCGRYGIYKPGSSSLTIAGHAKNGNTLTVKSTDDVISCPGSVTHISNCDVDMLSTNGQGIKTSGNGQLSITSSLAKGNSFRLVSQEDAVYAEGASIVFTNYDVDVRSLGGSGLYATSGEGLCLASTLEDGNKATVKSKKNGIVSYGSRMSFDNYTVEVSSEGYGLGAYGQLLASNSDITVESVKSSVYAISGKDNAITNSRLKASTTGTKQNDGDSDTYDAVFAPYGFTVNGGQLDATAQEGHYGVNIVQQDAAATLGWTKATDYFKASSYKGSIVVADGQTLKDGDANIYSGTIAAGEAARLNGRTLVPGSIVATFAPAGYATYYAGGYDLVLPEGMRAFAVTGKGTGAGTLKYKTIADGDTRQNIVPAGTAVMLMVAAADGEQTIPIAVGSGADAYSGDNLLGGSDTETLTTEAGGEAYYKLTYDNANTTFGWYWGAEDGQPFTSPAHKAWLALPAGVEARFLSLPGYETTGIVWQAQTRQSAWHTMDGVRLDGQPTAKGIYIKDGKKVVIK